MRAIDRSFAAARSSSGTTRSNTEWLFATSSSTETRVPPREDPYLSRLSEREIGFTEAGLLLLDAQVSAKEGKSESAQALLEGFAGKVPEPIAARFKPRDAGPGAKQERSSR